MEVDQRSVRGLASPLGVDRVDQDRVVIQISMTCTHGFDRTPDHRRAWSVLNGCGPNDILQGSAPADHLNAVPSGRRDKRVIVGGLDVIMLGCLKRQRRRVCHLLPNGRKLARTGRVRSKPGSPDRRRTVRYECRYCAAIRFARHLVASIGHASGIAATGRHRPRATPGGFVFRRKLSKAPPARRWPQCRKIVRHLSTTSIRRFCSRPSPPESYRPGPKPYSRSPDDKGCGQTLANRTGTVRSILAACGRPPSPERAFQPLLRGNRSPIRCTIGRSLRSSAYPSRRTTASIRRASSRPSLMIRDGGPRRDTALRARRGFLPESRNCRVAMFIHGAVSSA
jgi:hypothetical protein